MNTQPTFSTDAAEPGLLRLALRRAAAEMMARGLSNEAIAEQLGIEPAAVQQMEAEPDLLNQVRILLEMRKLRQYARAVEVNARLLEDESAAAGQKAVHEALSRFEDAVPLAAQQITVRFINPPDGAEG